MAQDAQADSGAEGGVEIGSGRWGADSRAGPARSRVLKVVAWLRAWPAWMGISLAATYLFFLEYLPPFQAVGVHSDLSGYHFPLLQYAWQALREGRLPLWDHVMYSGIPFVPIGQHGLFYPPNWLLFGAAALGRGMTYKSLEVLLMLHLCAGFLFCFAWLRERVKDNLAALAGAAAFAVGGMPLAQIQHVGVVSCYVWIPLALASVERARRENSLRPYLLVAVAAAMAFLAGYPPTMLAFVAVLLCWAAAGERPVRHVAAALGALGFALCLGAVQLLPSLEPHAGRFREDSYGGGLPHGAFTYALMFLPNYFDNARPASGVAAWGEYFYLGGAAVLGLACCCAWLYRTRAFGAVAAPLVTVAAALVLIENPWGVVGAAVRQWPMLAGMMREYNLLPSITVAACCLAAHGLAWGRAQEREIGGRPSMPRRVELAAMALAVVWCVGLVRRWVPGGQEFASGWGTLADLWCSFAVCGVLLSLSAAGRWRRWAAALFVVVALVELKSFGTNRSFSAEEGHADKRYRAMRDMRTDGHRMAGMEQAVLEQMLAARHYRVIVMDGLSPLELHYYGLATPQGFEASLPESYQRKVASYVPWRTNRMFEPDPADERFLRDFGVRYLICRRGETADRRVAALPHWRALGAEPAFFQVYEYAGAMPVYSWDGSATPGEWTPERRVFEVGSEHGGRFALLEQNQPGWVARVDGRETGIEDWNGVHQAVQIPGGRHRVEFEYRPAGLRAGMWISLSSLAVLLAAWIRRPSLQRP